MSSVVCIGDSLTYGYGVYNSQCWVTLTSKKLKIPFINKGINGDTTTGMLVRFTEDTLKSNPSHVVIMGGTNDFLLGYPLLRVEENIKLIIDDSIKHDVTPIISIEIPVCGTLAKKFWDSQIDYKKVNSKISDYRNWAVDYCLLKNIKYVDLYTSYEKYSHFENTNYYIDGIHPTFKGHEMISTIFSNSFKDFLK